MYRRIIFKLGTLYTDIQCVIRRYLLNTWIYIFYIYWNICNYWMPKCSPYLIYAESDGMDITGIMYQYYKYDTALSVSSAQYWLQRFGIHSHELIIVYSRRSDIIVSRIDLDNNIELLTRTECFDMQDIPEGLLYKIE